MKRLFHLLILTVVVIFVGAGCSGSPNPEEIQETFFEMLKVPAAVQSISEAGIYLDKNLSRIEEKNADHMVIAYEDYISSFDSTILIYKDFLTRYESYISNPLKNLYAIKVIEQEQPMQVDAVLKLSWREIADRAMVWETFIKENKDYSAVKEYATWCYTNYISAMLKGTTGTPIFDYKNQQFSKEAEESYIAFAAEYPDTAVTWTLNEYFAYLSSIKFRLNFNDATESKVFFETCKYLVSEAEKRAAQ